MGIYRSPKHTIGYRLLGGIYDRVQTVSDEVRRFTIASDRVNPDRVHTIYNGVDPSLEVQESDLDEFRQTIRREPRTCLISCVANLHPIKGIDVLVRAAALVAQKDSEARFIFAGGASGPGVGYADSVQRLSESLGTENVCQFIGQTKKVPALLNLSDIFVLPSRSEGLSNALLEAMRAELPCVGTAVGGTPEVIVDGETGFVVPPEDPEGLANRILKLLGDAQMRKEMGRAGRRRLIEKFTLEAMTTQVVASYLEELQRKCVRPEIGDKDPSSSSDRDLSSVDIQRVTKPTRCG
jgi:glycosyltransferase involved in cell wall biosynthesis